jgi:hypothetical protein
MKYAVEMGLVALIYIPGFMTIGSGIQNLMEGIHRHTGSMLVSQAYFYFFEIRKVC